MADLARANAPDSSNNVFIAGAAVAEHSDQMNQTLLNIRHGICLVYETSPFLIPSTSAGLPTITAVTYADVANSK